MIYKTGTLLSFEHGEYSSRGWDGPYRVLKDIDQAEVSLIAKDDFGEDGYLSARDFPSWLIKNGYIEFVESSLWYVGEYGFNPDIYPVK